jgi:hypothetical protein
MEAYRVVRRRGSYISRTIRSQMAVQLSALRAGRSLTPERSSGTHLCYKLSKPQAMVRLEELSANTR